MKLTRYQNSSIPFSLPNLLHVSGSKRFKSEKGIRSAVAFLSRASFGALSTASFLRIPTCPGIHIKTISFWSALILCNRSCICISRGWSVFFNFPSACKTDNEWVWLPNFHDSLNDHYKSPSSCLSASLSFLHTLWIWRTANLLLWILTIDLFNYTRRRLHVINTANWTLKKNVSRLSMHFTSK